MKTTFENLERSNSFITCEICARIDYPNSPNFGYDCFTKKMKCVSCVVHLIQIGQHDRDISSLCCKYRRIRTRFREKLKISFLSAEDHSDDFRNILDSIENVMWMDATSVELYEDSKTIIARVKAITHEMTKEDQYAFPKEASPTCSDFHRPCGRNESILMEKMRQVI